MEVCRIKNIKRIAKKSILVIAASSAFLFQGCSNSDLDGVGSNNNTVQENSRESNATSSPAENGSVATNLPDENEDSLLYFSKDVSVIKVSHSNGGGKKSWIIDKKDISEFREWVLSLQLVHEKNKSPGEFNGADAYIFRIDDKTPVNFTYMDLGDAHCYIEIKGKWYRITNHKRMPKFLDD